MQKPAGNITIPGDANVWPHEYQTALALAKSGRSVVFIKKSESDHQSIPDILMDGLTWELKAPTASNIKAVERNLKRGRWQSSRIVFDSRRMKGIPDAAIERELRKHAFALKGIDRVLFVNRRGDVVDIR